MGVQKERKRTFLTAFEHREKSLFFAQYFYRSCLLHNIFIAVVAACFLHNIFIAVVSECLCHLRAQYPVQLPDICSG